MLFTMNVFIFVLLFDNNNFIYINNNDNKYNVNKKPKTTKFIISSLTFI